MAIYHCNFKIISRKKGQSAVAGAAYISASKMINSYDGVIHDYTKKGGVVYTEILLPDTAPESFNNREELWNAVELSEKNCNAQLARGADLALPLEFTREEQIQVLRDYIKTNFTSVGMCADFCIHDKNDGNPHAHILLTMRKVNKDGSFQPKQKKIYEYDKNGNKIYDPVKRQYKCKTIKTTDWDSTEKLKDWRKSWADICNNKFIEKGLDERISEKNFSEISPEKIATKHLGKEATALERQGIKTEKGKFNVWARDYNNSLITYAQNIKELETAIKVYKRRKNKKYIRGNYKAYSSAIIKYNSLLQVRYKNRVEFNQLKAILEDIQKYNVTSYANLTQRISGWDNIRTKQIDYTDKLKRTKEVVRVLQMKQKTQPVQAAYLKAINKKKYYAAHESELRSYYYADKQLSEWKLTGEPEELIKKYELNIEKLNAAITTCKAKFDDYRPLIRLKKSIDEKIYNINEIKQTQSIDRIKR